MATYNKFNQTVADVNNGVHNMGANTLKFALTNTAPVAGNTIFANITEISAGNGYAAGGTTVAITSSTQSGGTYSLVPTADVVFTACPPIPHLQAFPGDSRNEIIWETGEVPVAAVNGNHEAIVALEYPACPLICG